MWFIVFFHTSSNLLPTGLRSDQGQVMAVHLLILWGVGAGRDSVYSLLSMSVSALSQRHKNGSVLSFTRFGYLGRNIQDILNCTNRSRDHKQFLVSPPKMNYGCHRPCGAGTILQLCVPIIVTFILVIP